MSKKLCKNYTPQQSYGACISYILKLHRLCFKVVYRSYVAKLYLGYDFDTFRARSTSTYNLYNLTHNLRIQTISGIQF